jgi:transposase-like protein
VINLDTWKKAKGLLDVRTRQQAQLYPEVAVKISGETHYLWRAQDHEG